MQENLTLDGVLKFIETLKERVDHKNDKVKELLKINEAILKDFKEIEQGVSGIRVADKIRDRDELLNWLEEEAKDVKELEEVYQNKLHEMINAEKERIQDIQKTIMTMR